MSISATYDRSPVIIIRSVLYLCVAQLASEVLCEQVEFQWLEIISTNSKARDESHELVSFV